MITDTEQIVRYLHTIQASSRKDYTTNSAPGTPVINPDDIAYKSEENYFCPVKLIPNKIEYLRLQCPNHVRILFSRIDTDWSGEFLVS